MSARRILVVILTLGILATPVPTEAQQSAKVPRIGWLSIASRTPAVSHLLEAFWQGLRELGYVEGQNIAVEYRFAEGRPERLPEFAAQLVALKVDIIVTPNPAGTQAAREATSTIPIVFMGVADPVGSGLVASLARPGGNITGLTPTASPGMLGKRLELLKETVPKASRVAVLRNPTNPEDAHTDVERCGRRRAGIGSAAPSAGRAGSQRVGQRLRKDDQRPSGRAPRNGGYAIHASPGTDRSPRDQEAATGDLLGQRVCGGWPPHGLRTEPPL